jgi:nucleoside 2-deoxyribosyltransferase
MSQASRPSRASLSFKQVNHPDCATMKPRFSVYFAGGLFSHKDLVGNRLLADSIAQESRGRFRCVLPQHLEVGAGRAVQMRNADLLALLKSDLAIFNFDGAELDSGTVVEFIFAKMLDMPAVILRTDFRAAGDQEQDHWNLMCSAYPRTKVVSLNGMDWYQQHFAQQALDSVSLEKAYSLLARPIIDNLDLVIKEPAITAGGNVSLAQIYAWALRFPGGGLSEGISAEDLQLMISQKIAKGLYPT